MLAFRNFGGILRAAVAALTVVALPAREDWIDPVIALRHL